MSEARVHLTLDRADAEWLQEALGKVRHQTENAVVESTLSSALTETRKTLRVMHVWPDSPTETTLTTVHEENGVTPDELIEALIDVTEAVLVEVTAHEFDGMRTPLSPALASDDRQQMVFLNARLSLLHQIINRPPSRATVVG